MEKITRLGPSRTSRDWHHDNCYGCGPENDHQLGAEYPFDEEHGEVRFEYEIKKHMEGAPGYCHGGVLAALLDEAQGTLCFHLGHFVMTDQLYMNYHKATKLDQKVVVRTWLTLVRRKRLYTKGTVHSADGELLASSKARWFSFSTRMIDKMFKDKWSEGRGEELRQIIEANRQRNKEIRKRIREAKKNSA